MQHIQAMSDFDRRSVLFFGAAGAAALFGGVSSALADDAKIEELAPGVTMKTLKEVAPVGPVPGFSKALLLEITFQPGSTLTDPGSKTVDICEILGAPLYAEIKGKDPMTLQPGDIYFCPVGNVETDTNKSDKASIMRIIELVPA